MSILTQTRSSRLHNNSTHSKYRVALCQHFTREIHGFDCESSPNINNHYLCVYIINQNEPADVDFAIQVLENQHHHNNNHNNNNNTETLPQQENQCNKLSCLTLEIIEVEILTPGNEAIAIYKTFWLRIFQKKYRRWLALKAKVRATFISNKIDKMLMFREMNGLNIKNTVS